MIQVSNPSVDIKYKLNLQQAYHLVAKKKQLIKLTHQTKWAYYHLSRIMILKILSFQENKNKFRPRM